MVSRYAANSFLVSAALNSNGGRHRDRNLRSSDAGGRVSFSPSPLQVPTHTTGNSLAASREVPPNSRVNVALESSIESRAYCACLEQVSLSSARTKCPRLLS